MKAAMRSFGNVSGLTIQPGGLDVGMGLTKFGGNSPGNIEVFRRIIDGRTTSLTYTLIKSYKILATGSYRVGFILTADGPLPIGTTVFARVYKNGVPYGREWSTNKSSYLSCEEDLYFDINDTLEIWARTANANWEAYISEMYIRIGPVITG